MCSNPAKLIHMYNAFIYAMDDYKTTVFPSILLPLPFPSLPSPSLPSPSLPFLLLPSSPLPSPLPRLTSGLENTLLHYVALHPGRGVMVCPTHATPPGPVHAELVQSFRQTSVAVREVLRGRVEGERTDEGEEADEYDSESDEEQGTTVEFPSSS